MNARQRRGLLMLVLAAVLGLTTFVLLSNYVGSVRAEVGSTVEVWRVRSDVEAFTPLTPEVVERVAVPDKWVAPGTARNDEFLGRRAGTRLPAGAYVREEVLLPRNELNEGEREIAINVDAETGVAGRLQPGDYVNINVTLEEQAQGEGVFRVAAVLVRRARIVSFGSERTADRLDGTPAQVIPVTFALSEADSLRLLYAESFATSVRLSKVLPEDTRPPGDGDPYTSGDVHAEFAGQR